LFSASLAIEVFTDLAEPIATGPGAAFVVGNVLSWTASAVVMMDSIARWLVCFVDRMKLGNCWHDFLLQKNEVSGLAEGLP
jgi:hypothetical protein